MEHQAEAIVRYRVTRAASGMWDVIEEGFEVPIASFQRREEAVGYVRRLAAIKRLCEVEIDGA